MNLCLHLNTSTKNRLIGDSLFKVICRCPSLPWVEPWQANFVPMSAWKQLHMTKGIDKYNFIQYPMCVQTFDWLCVSY